MNSILTSVLLLSFCLHEGSSSEREHKVHNIVLYPEKHSWCQITPIQQVVGSPGYDPVTIDNNVCVGACYSYSIPKTQPAEPGELIGPHCDSCQPSEIQCYHVNLKQSTKNTDEKAAELLQKKVQIITNCTCQSCETIERQGCDVNDGATLELPDHLFTEEKYTNNKNSMDSDLPDLLERQGHQSKNDVKFKNKLKKWFETYQQGKNDRDESIAKIAEDLDELPNSFKVEEPTADHMKIQLMGNVVVVEDDAERKRKDTKVDHVEAKVGHVEAKVGHVEAKVGHVEAKVGHVEAKVGHVEEHHHNHRHHLGEEQQIGESLVHLIKGPHGSMVAAPVEAKLHIDSDDLKPNSEGIVINYENHNYKPQEDHVPEM